ncbi:chitinase-3-like protein 2 [Pleuronectes platessa]|uniref:chitinase-3-like protein 2 n=1 Tax=Pleuronectes platessa TaxID=8262 RepID=UPI00232A6786|nr:chitinase-3-like protein 2 [Pleuronectes platessa]
MCNIVLTAGLCLVIASLGSSERLVCYFNSLAEDRADAGKFTIEDIDPNKCTHLIYAFSDINDFNELVPTRRADIFRYQLFNGLKNRNPSLKTLLAVGGPTFNKEKFTTMVSTTQNRTTFIQSAVALLRIFQFDGLNLDWMYPVGAGGDPDNKQKFTLLCKDLNAAFETEGKKHNRDRLILTASVSAEREVIDSSYEVKMITKDLDFLNVLTFDFHSSCENVTGHHSPLYMGSHDVGDQIYYNTDSAMQYWVDKGAPAQLLNLGLAAYGRAFSLSSASSDVGAPASGAVKEGCYTGEEGFWAYYETCLYTEGATFHWIADQKVPYAITENQWVGFDDTVSISVKVSYLKAKKFGGAFVWSLDLDDFSGKFCNQSKSPLISHLNSLLVQCPCNGVTAGLVPNPSDKTTYYDCSGPVLLKCPVGEEFKKKTSTCETTTTATAMTPTTTTPTSLCLVIASLGSSERLVCYFNSLAEDRADAGKFTIEDIDPNKCTHLIYAFSDINDFNELEVNNWR